MMPLDEDNIKAQLKDNATEISLMRHDIAKLTTTVAVLAEKMEHRVDRCPMRVDISRAGNGATQALTEARAATTLATRAIDLTVENRVGIAKLAAMAAGGGASGGLAVYIIQALMQLR